MKRIYIFCGISFGLTYLISFLLMFNGGASNPLYIMGLSLCMLTPTIANILTRLITKEGFKNCYLKFNFRKTTAKYYLLGWLGTEILILLGGLLYYLVYPKTFDPSLSGLGQLLTTQIQTTGGIAPEYTSSMLWGILMMQLLAGLLFALPINIPFMFGEEFGWRGYLLPKLVEEKGIKKALIYSGVIWSLWHAPMIAMGHNYGLHYPLFPIPGILAMVVFCVTIGILMSYITLRTQSVWPAVLCHAVINGTAAFTTLFHTINIVANPFIGPAITGIIGGLPLILVAIYLYIKLTKHEDN